MSVNQIKILVGEGPVKGIGGRCKMEGVPIEKIDAIQVTHVCIFATHFKKKAISQLEAV